MCRERLANRRDGGCNHLRRLAAQPAIDGADLGRLNHSLLQPAAGSDVEIEVEAVDPRRRPAARSIQILVPPKKLPILNWLGINQS
jgi:hypothetical protein